MGDADPGFVREGEEFRPVRLFLAASSQNLTGNFEWKSVGSILSRIVLLNLSALPLSCGECGGPME